MDTREVEIREERGGEKRQAAGVRLQGW